jgi:hypothetical protein
LATQTIGGNTLSVNTSQDSLYLCPIVAGQTCSVSAVGVYCNSNVSGYSIQVAIYSDSGGSPNALLANSNSATVSTSAGWLDVSLNSSVTMTNGTQYWPAVNNNLPGGKSGDVLTLYYISSGTSYHGTETFGTWPNTLSGLESISETLNMRITTAAAANNPIEVVQHKFQPIFMYPV